MVYRDYDQVLEEIGECGLWQTSLFILLCVPAALSSISIFIFEFAASTPAHRCVGTSNNSILLQTINNSSLINPWDDDQDLFSSCSHPKPFGQIGKEEADRDSILPCSMWVFDTSIFSSTAVEDFSMVCHNSWRKNTAQTANMAGMLVGSLLCGLVSDKVGRKPTLMLSLAPLLLGGCLPLSFPANPDFYWLLVLARFISGFGAVGAFIMALCLSLEYVGASYRVLLGILIQVPFTIGGLLVGFVSWAGVRDWKLLMFSLSIPNLFILSYWCILPESPRWLLVENDEAEYEKVIKMAAKINRRPLPNKTSSPLLSHSSPIKFRETEKSSVLDILRSGMLLRRSVVMIFNWMVVFLCYFGITMTSASFSDEMYLNYTLVFLVDLPSQLFCLLCLEKVGRKSLFGGSQLLAGITFLAAGAAILLEQQWVEVLLTLVGKFGVASALAVMFVYTAELFPTSMRNTAVGTCSLFARIGGMLAPQVVSLGTLYFHSLPLIFMGVISLIGGILILGFLPETLGKPLPDTIKDALDLEKPQRRNTAEQKLIEENA